MAEENKYQISQYVAFPNQLSPFDEKKLKSFGLSIGAAISSQWFYRGTNNVSCRYYTSQAEFINRRNYASGNINMAKYYPKLGTNGDVSLLNLSKKPLTRIPKIVDLVVNAMCDRGMSIEASAIDPISQDNKQAYRRQIEDDMNSKDIIVKAKETFGVDVGSMPVEKLPETQDELNLHLQMEYKPSIELSAELGIKMVMDENMYDLTIDRQIKRDLVVDGIACVENRFNGAKGIILDWVDPIEMVYSDTKDPYFRDCFYKGRVKKALISDVLIEYPDLLSDDNKQIRQQLDNSGAWWDTYHNISNSTLNSGLRGHTYLLYFTYKTYRETANKIKTKATGEKVISKADINFDESKLEEKGQTNDYQRVSKVEEVLFEGCMVLGTNIILKWELAKSMARPKSNNQKVVEQYQMIAPNYREGEITSLVSRMIPIDDLLNVVELKAEQILQGITPDGIAIDVDALAELDLGEGKGKIDEMGQFNMWLQKGSFFYRSYGAGGDFNNAQKPFMEIKTGDSINKLVALRNESNTYLQELTDVIGLNKASDASTPDKDSLVGVQKLAASNSNTATRHVLKGAGYITLRTAEAIIYRISDILKYYPSLRDDLIRKIGQTAVMDLDYIKDLHLSDFAIFLTLEQDADEIAQLDADLSLAMEKGYITLADKYKVKNVKIFKQAVAYLAILIEKNTKRQQEQKMQDIQANTQSQTQIAQAAEQAKQQTAQLEGQIKSQLLQVEGQNAIAKENAKGEQDRQSLQVEYIGKTNLQYIINSGQVEKTQEIEDRKDDREAQRATLQSELIDQRAKDKDPTDFEAKREGAELFELTE